jgi:hypothetical protein
MSLMLKSSEMRIMKFQKRKKSMKNDKIELMKKVYFKVSLFLHMMSEAHFSTYRKML